MENVLKYKDERDKSMGIAGMAISIVINDKEDYLASVSLEEGENSFNLSEEFYFVSNPRISARIAWNELLNQYQIASGLLLSNVLCRNYVEGKSPTAEMLETIHNMIIDEGRDHCSLDEDEAEKVYSSSLNYYRRIFMHPSVCAIARDFSDRLIRDRRMSAGEVFDALRRLASI